MSDNVIDMKSVSVVRNGKYLLKNVDLTISDKENIAIIGPNGSGKTTLVKLFSGEILPYFDENGKTKMSIFGQERWNIFDLRSKIGIVSMDLQNKFNDDVIVSDVILSGYFGSLDIFRNHEVSQDMVKAVYYAAVKMGVEDKLDCTIGKLSLGEMRRVLIARALVSNPSLLILDEPMTGLDIVMKDAFRKMFDILSETGVKIVMITHELEDIPSSINRVIMIKDGEKIVDGIKSKVLNDQNLSNLYDESISVEVSRGIYRMHIRGEN